MKIAITGASGRIGRAIHFSLCQNNNITGIDRSVASVTTHLGDIEDYTLLSKAFRGADANRSTSGCCVRRPVNSIHQHHGTLWICIPPS
jgi:nucleoside-diphosphate-sugar epimerase